MTGDPENTHTTHARFYDEAGLVARFPVPGFKVSRLTSTHLIYTTKTELKKVDFQGHQVWSVPLAIRRFVVSRDGSALLGVVDTRERGEVVHVDLATGNVVSNTALDGAFWNMDISASHIQLWYDLWAALPEVSMATDGTTMRAEACHAEEGCLQIKNTTFVWLSPDGTVLQSGAATIDDDPISWVGSTSLDAVSGTLGDSAAPLGTFSGQVCRLSHDDCLK